MLRRRRDGRDLRSHLDGDSKVQATLMMDALGGAARRCTIPWRDDCREGKSERVEAAVMRDRVHEGNAVVA